MSNATLTPTASVHTSPRPDNMSHSRSPSFFSLRRANPPSPSSASLPMQVVPPSSTTSHGSQASLPSPVHSEIRSLVQLNTAHAYKIYYSGPLVHKIETLPDGQRPLKDDGWTDIWAQLRGTTLNIWVMKQVQEASKQGREVPPTYFNVTDAFIHVIGAITTPETSTSPAKRYTDILAMNTAGSNLILFSCPSKEALMAWVAALRLSSWEKSRLEEIYTAHLIRTTQQARDIPSTLVQGRIEGWAQIRIACQTDWKRLWLVIQAGPDGERPSSSGGYDSNGLPRKKRISFFSRDPSPARSVAQQPMLLCYSSPKPKDRKRPLLTLQSVTQAFAVYPERTELISKSTLIKVEGQFADEELVREMKNREGWIMVMPEIDKAQNQAEEMLKWIIALHDAFGLYGRPRAWTWDPREPASMMFGYPVGPQKESLFLDREAAEALDPRDDRTSFIRANLQSLLSNKLQNAGIRVIPPGSPQQLALQPQFQQQPQQQQQPPEQNHVGGYSLLPPLSFSDIGLQQKTLLAPVAESSTEAKSDPPINTTSSPLNTTSPPLNTASPSVNTTSPPIDTPPMQPVATAFSPSYLSTTNNQGHQKSSSITSPTLSGASSPNPSSPPKTTVMTKSREDSITRSSFSSNRDRSQPTALSASHSTTDDRPASRTSILTSPHSIADKALASDKRRSLETALPLASPYSPVLSRRDLPPIGPPPSKALPTAPSDDLSTEAGALYYMSNIEAEPDRSTKKPATRIPTTIAEQDDTASSRSEHERATGSSVTVSSSLEPVTPRTVFERPDPAARQSPIARSGLRRKPSGAREPGTGRSLKNGFSSSTKSLAEDTESDDSMERSQIPPPQVKVVQPLPSEDANLDVLAALSYLNVNDGSPPALNTTEPLKVRNQKMSPPSSPAPSPSISITTPTATTIDEKAASQFRSSFALSKQAVERKAKAQAQQMAHHAAVHKPGRLNGKRKAKAGGAWNESSDEEEEEDDDDDDDDEADSDSDNGPASNKRNPPSSGHASSNASHRPPQNSTHMSHRNETMADYQGVQPRGPRNLPQVPNRPYGEDHPHSRRMVSDQLSDVGRRPNHDENPQMRSQSEFPHPGSAQKSLWSQVLDPGRTTGHFPENTRDTFIQLEHPSETMTKAFTPQGLLSAGLQDKQDRSAKRQEELARETGASLINVPNKPPPPQTGLLGAITAHERERKREGGMGAALTEREREKRVAEERQRRFDEQQRQQLEQMQQGGSMYGQFPGYNPMINPMMMGMMPMNPMNPMNSMNPMNPMMTGMTPMMTGGMAPMMTGYNPMMPALNAQQMFAAQKAAAQAYQQAMMAYSTAGSQMGGGDNGGAAQPMVPNTTGNMPFMGYDPRMSMMGMGMMGPQMGMPLGMQMTGMSTFDPRFSMNPGNGGSMNDLGLQPPNVLGAQNPASRSSSPARRDSPAVRPAPDQHGEVARGSSPKL